MFSASEHWTCCDADTCPILDTCPYPNKYPKFKVNSKVFVRTSKHFTMSQTETSIYVYAQYNNHNKPCGTSSGLSYFIKN